MGSNLAFLTAANAGLFALSSGSLVSFSHYYTETLTLSRHSRFRQSGWANKRWQQLESIAVIAFDRERSRLISQD